MKKYIKKGRNPNSNIANLGKHFSIDTRKKMSDWQKGNPSPMAGKHHSNESKEKLRLSRLGKKHTEETKGKISENNGRGFLGKHHSIETKLKIGKVTNKGYNTSIATLIRNSEKNKKWRQDVFIKDDFTCQDCGLKGGRLIAHHKKPFHKFIEEIKINLPLLDLYEGAMIYTPLWEISNGKTLCDKCHNKINKRR